MKKSQLIGFLLKRFWLVHSNYSTPAPRQRWGFRAAIVFGVLTAGIALVIWPNHCQLFTVHRHNSKVALEERRVQELLEATKGTENPDG